MKRIIKAVLILAGILGTMLLEQGCRPTCYKMPSGKYLVLNYPDLPLGQYQVIIYRTERNAINKVIDTLQNTLTGDTLENFKILIHFDELGVEGYKYWWLIPSINLNYDSWEIPHNFIIEIQNTNYKDTLSEITFYNDPKRNCTSEDAVRVTLKHNNKSRTLEAYYNGFTINIQ